MQRSVRLVEGGWIQMRNQPINIMVGSRCVCSLSVGILRLMSPPLRVGANIHFDTAYSQFPNTTFADHSCQDWGAGGNRPGSCGTLWPRCSPPSPILFGFKGKLKGTGARCKTTRKVMTQATDCINSARKSCEVSFRCLFLQELIRNGGRGVSMIGIIYPISTIIIAKTGRLLMFCHVLNEKGFNWLFFFA